MLKEIILAIEAYFVAHRFTITKGRFKKVIVFGVLYALVFALALYSYYRTANLIIEAVLQQTSIKQWLQSNNKLLTFFFAATIIMIHWLLLLYYFCLVQFFLLIITSPLLSYWQKRLYLLSYRDIVPHNMPSNKVLARKASILALKNLGWLSLYFILLVVVALLPIVGWITPLIGSFALCYYWGSSMLHYSFLLQGNSNSTSLQKQEQYKGLCIGNGLIFYLLHLLPIIGWVIAPIYSIIASQYSCTALKEATN